MKKTFSFFATILLTASINAQVKIAIKAGPNFSTARAYFNDIKQPTNFTTGFGVGVVADVPFEGVLYFTPSASINRRGYIIKPLTGTTTKEQYGITYLDLIPALSIHLPQGKNSFAFTLGPDFGFTDFGKLKSTDNNNVTTSQKLKFGYNDIGWFDVGLSASIGYHTQKMFVEAAYLCGFVNTNNNVITDQRDIRSRTLSLNIGYYIR